MTRLATIIPAYNRADLIGDTLRSVLGQERAPDEVIVVDDGSTDATADAVAAFGAAVRLLRQDNAGPGAARNAGLAAATGEVVHFMDSDDLLSPNFYAASLARIAAGADFTYCPWLKTRIAGRSLVPDPVVLQQRPVAARLRPELKVLLGEWYTVLQPCLMRRAIVTRAGPFPTGFHTHEDLEFLARVLREAQALAHVPEALVLYRVHPESQISELHLERRLRDRAQAWDLFGHHLAAHPERTAALARRFRRRKVAVARDVAVHHPGLAATLRGRTTWLARIADAVSEFGEAQIARVRNRVLRTGYHPAFGAGPLRDDQRALIARMGFELPAAA